MTRHGWSFPAAGLAAAVMIVTGAPARAEDQPVREITHIAGDLYRFQNNFHYSVFLVTPEGVLVTDPINADAAAWLKAEIDARHGLPIRYVIHSHDHADHVSGGAVFGEQAIVVAHANARRHIIDDDVPTAVPQITFTDRMTLRLGGKTVELVYLGRNHGDSLAVMNFTDARTLFAVDLVAVNRMPYNDLPGAFLDEWIAALAAMETLDFDILAPGHGPMGSRADVAPHRRYLEELRAAVAAEIAAGRSLDEIKRRVTMADYGDWLRYDDWLGPNIEGMYRILTGESGG
jgi:glyoxylase-like metal-dependent hydrolase (beta-lactamase superfamily II)